METPKIIYFLHSGDLFLSPTGQRRRQRVRVANNVLTFLGAVHVGDPVTNCCVGAYYVPHHADEEMGMHEVKALAQNHGVRTRCSPCTSAAWTWQQADGMPCAVLMPTSQECLFQPLRLDAPVENKSHCL